AIKFSFDGSEYHSSLDRRPDELALLTKYGREIQGMFLHSYLFFGSANRLHQHVKALLAKQKCRFLLFDFRLVTGIDSSAIFSFTQIKQVADQCGARMIFTRLTLDVENAFRAARFISDHIIVAPNLDAALESCENAIIEAHQTRDSEAGTLREWFTEALGGAENADQLIQHCKRIEVQPGEIIVREGDPANSMHFILDGRVGIMVNGCSAPVRVRSLGPHTTIGEMGLITRQPRSATMQAELVSVLYELSASAYERISRENPGLSHALMTYIITVMAERLSFANRAIGVLQPSPRRSRDLDRARPWRVPQRTRSQPGRCAHQIGDERLELDFSHGPFSSVAAARFSPLARRGAQDALRLLLILQEPSGESASGTARTIQILMRIRATLPPYPPIHRETKKPRARGQGFP